MSIKSRVYVSNATQTELHRCRIQDTLRLQHLSSPLARFATGNTILGGKTFLARHRWFRASAAISIATGLDDTDEFRTDRMTHVASRPCGRISESRMVIAYEPTSVAASAMSINMTGILPKFNVDQGHLDYGLELWIFWPLKPPTVRVWLLCDWGIS